MNYRIYAPKDAAGKNLETRKVRKGSRKQKFADNHALHSARAKQEAKSSN